MNSPPFRLLIVGAGLTGSGTSALIKRRLPTTNVDINIWEKSRGIGGRMTTHRNEDGLGSVDLGAQYLTKNAEIEYAKKHQM